MKLLIVETETLDVHVIAADLSEPFDEKSLMME